MPSTVPDTVAVITEPLLFAMWTNINEGQEKSDSLQSKFEDNLENLFVVMASTMIQVFKRAVNKTIDSKSFFVLLHVPVEVYLDTCDSDVSS